MSGSICKIEPDTQVRIVYGLNEKAHGSVQADLFPTF